MGNTEHIHFKVIVPGRPTLTSQFYFPDARRNTSDGIFDAKLLLAVTERMGGAEARIPSSWTCPDWTYRNPGAR